MSSALARTPLHAWHAAHQARLVDFAGWSMPVQYASIVAEHTATRTAIGLFDISHMGRLRFDGPEAAAALDQLVTRRVIGMPTGSIRYALVTNEQGGILDDVLVYHLNDRDGRPFHLLVVNAGNRAKIAHWIGQHLPVGSGVSWHDQTLDTAMIAVQGPQAVACVAPLIDGTAVGELKYYTGASARFAGQPVIVTRTGYTGEDGCELIVSAASAESIWERLWDAGRPRGALAAGLGARDTLRLEAAMPLYGHELNESINPYQAGLAFAVNLDRRRFIGCEALADLRGRTDLPRRVGLALDGRRVPREHCAVWWRDRQVGEVTSGTFSPTLERPLAMAYVSPDASSPGTELEIDIRGRREPARVVALPFYRRSV